MTAAQRRSALGRVMVLIMTIAAVVAILFVGRAEPVAPTAPTVGEPSPQQFVASGFVEVVDEDATEAARQLARNNVPTQYQTDPTVSGEVRSSIRQFFNDVKEAAQPATNEAIDEIVEQVEQPPEEPPPAEEQPPTTGEDGETTTTSSTTTTTTTTTTTIPELPAQETQLETLRLQYPLINNDVFVPLVEIANDDFFRELEGQATYLDDLAVRAEEIANGLLEDGILSSELDDRRNELALAPEPLAVFGLNEEQRDAAERAVSQVVAEFLDSNRAVDQVGTETAREAAAAEVEDITVQFVADQVIVDEGDLVTPVQAAAIEMLDLLEAPEGTSYPALAAVAAVIVLLSMLFLSRVTPERWARPKLVALFGMLIVLAAVAARVPEVVAGDNPELGYLLPAAAFGFLAAILFEPRAALLVAIPLGAFTALATGELSLTVFSVAAAIAPVPFVSAASTRTQLRLAVLLAGAVLVPIGGTLGWFFAGGEAGLRAAAAAGVGGIIAGVAGLGLLPFFENLFRLTTTLTLLDLTDRNHPALRLIEEQAPGTFNHSIMVGTLAGRAAREIGANALLAQAAAYYHDLGKTVQPQFFVENQFGVSNPHDELTPEQSAAIIRRHVTEGLRLAKRYRLPEEVTEGIRQHHGDGIMRFFYHKALEQQPGTPPDDYRHNGVKPKRKEMAILMLADATEGAVRALVQVEDPSRDNIGKTVESVIEEKLDDGQLDNSSLTFGELTIVKHALIDALVGYYHNRIPYPGFPGAR